jgi:hypothetical protein
MEKVTTYQIDNSTKAKFREHGEYNEKITVSIYKAGSYAAIASKTFAGCDRETLADKFRSQF